MTPPQTLPSFSLSDTRGTVHESQAYLGAPLVLYVFRDPKKVATMALANGFHETRKEFRRRGAAVLGVSGRTAEENARFVRALALNHPLLRDPELELIRALGAWRTPKAQGRWNGVLPGAVLFDAAGQTVDRWFAVRKLETVAALVLERLPR